jgi:hypothetical protein
MEVALVEALTPSTAGQAGLSRSALYRDARAGRLDRAKSPVLRALEMLG